MYRGDAQLEPDFIILLILTLAIGRVIEPKTRRFMADDCRRRWRRARVADANRVSLQR